MNNEQTNLQETSAAQNGNSKITELKGSTLKTKEKLRERSQQSKTSNLPGVNK